MKNKQAKTGHQSMSHAELVSASSTHVVLPWKQQRQALKILNQVQNDTLFNDDGFTLIELLVVVLIIGILAAVALPQYEKAVEKARMTEAIMNVRAIAKANEVFFMENGRYAEQGELNLLDIDIPGTDYEYGGTRKQTNYFIYSPNGSEGVKHLALAHRIPFAETYYLYISQTAPTRLRCYAYSSATAVQRKLCEQIEANGTL